MTPSLPDLPIDILVARILSFECLPDQRKVIMFEPPDCKARDEARVLQCWTKGRI